MFELLASIASACGGEYSFLGHLDPDYFDPNSFLVFDRFVGCCEDDLGSIIFVSELTGEFLIVRTIAAEV